MSRTVVTALVAIGLASACTIREETTVQKPMPASTAVVVPADPPPPPPPPTTTTVIMR
ncbi:MAG: hypothetical protein KIT25_09555 [Enhydrobacter sp.]|nr:MAG: hypothetical protein KIT25_09555 [Enhydrobacter sp.]